MAAMHVSYNAVSNTNFFVGRMNLLELQLNYVFSSGKWPYQQIGNLNKQYSTAYYVFDERILIGEKVQNDGSYEFVHLSFNKSTRHFMNALHVSSDAVSSNV